MISAKGVKKNDDFLNWLKHLESSNHEVEVGVFSEQGLHPTAGDMTYVDLLRLHASNPSANTPTRDVIGELGLMLRENQLKLPEIQAAIMKWATTPFSSANDKELLDSIGKAVRDLGKYAIFGNPNVLAPNSRGTIARKNGRNTPLVDDGHLQNAFAFKTSLDKMIKENG